jgi:uncharacterized protein YbjQ (UPF0145 family)
MSRVLPLIAVLCLEACATSYVVPVQQNVVQPVVAALAPPSAAVVAAPAQSSRVLILQSTHLDRMSEVVGVVDVHEEMGRHEEALEELRRAASALGADAVVGVEFHHGEGEGEPTHLSGLAVRFLSP